MKTTKMSEIEEYKASYEEIDRVYDLNPDDLVNSLRFLVEDMLDSIQRLELEILQLKKELKER